MPTAEKLFVHVAIVLLLSTHVLQAAMFGSTSQEGVEGPGRGPGGGRGWVGGGSGVFGWLLVGAFMCNLRHTLDATFSSSSSNLQPAIDATLFAFSSKL